MSQQDRIRSLEYEKSRLARQIAGVDARTGEFDAPSIRYVQQYATDSDPDQPVQVKRLRWDTAGEDFVAYGTEFRIGDADTPDEVGAGDKFFIIWRGDAERWYPIGGAGQEAYRLIRGQSVGAQSGATVLIDNVLEIAGGLDPTNGNPATQITVQNLFSQSFSDNEAVQAIYHEGLGGTLATDWEAVKTTSGTETYRAIRGLAVGAVTADDTTLSIDNVIPLAGGLDPVAGNPATTVTVQNLQKEAFTDNTPVTAIYDGTDWELLLVERYRLVRGQATTDSSEGPGTIAIDNIKTLASGLDPRSDPTSATEVLVVTKTWEDKYKLNNDIVAAYNVVSGTWDIVNRGLRADGLTIEIERTGTALKVLLLLDGEEISSDTLTLEEVVINHPTSIELNLDSDSLDSILHYVPRTVTIFASADSSAVNFSDTVPVEPC